ncbi:MAG: PHB depolymerase family esterase [Myxococcota bacterium]
MSGVWRSVLVVVVAWCSALGCLAHERGARGPTVISAWGHRFYFPASAPAAKRIPLVVYLHGCQQVTWHSLRTTRLEEWAEQRGFAVLMPEQSRLRNPWKCWNWFLGDDAYEMNEIVALVKDYQARFPLLKTRTYVMGLSAGGVMTAHLLACRSDVFEAGAVVGGAPYGVALPPDTLLGELAPARERMTRRALRCLEQGRARRPVSVLVIHGTWDVISLPHQGPQTAKQFAGANHLLEHGEAGWRSAITPVEVVERDGDDGGLGYTVTRYPPVEGARVELVQVHGMGHGWSGGPWWLPFSDHRGPDATALALEFFGLAVK